MVEKHMQNLCLEEKDITFIKISNIYFSKNTTRHFHTNNLIRTIEIIILFTRFHSLKIENITKYFFINV